LEIEMNRTQMRHTALTLMALATALDACGASSESIRRCAAIAHYCAGNAESGESPHALMRGASGLNPRSASVPVGMTPFAAITQETVRDAAEALEGLRGYAPPACVAETAATCAALAELLREYPDSRTALALHALSV
jgi:hypothetical protein